MTFTTLHQAIAERDTGLIGSMCEANLRSALYEFFDVLDEEDCEVKATEVVEDEQDSTNIRVDIIDFEFVSGYMSMSREECRLNGVYQFKGFSVPNHRSMFVVPMANIDEFDELRSHLQLMVRIQSNLGLRLVDTKTNEQYPKTVYGKEIHYLKMEGVLATADINKSLWSIKDIV